ncbi:MAG: prolyl-tRNA synthetase associated domain-containing protein [Bacteroidales bacterium]|nr:prolyl-tRNA synthetase associated domain-containing protein [Bacteroidales bacterium]
MTFFVSEIKKEAPVEFETDTQRRIYETLEKLGVEFGRVDTDDGTTMESCVHISKGLGCPVVKTIFLCNRQQTVFYLYVTAAEKPFVTRDFCGALGVPRVSFAPTEMLWEKLGTRMGATTMLSLINDMDQQVTLVIDRDVAARTELGCTDGTTTCFLKLPMPKILDNFLAYTGHTAVIIG